MKNKLKTTTAVRVRLSDITCIVFPTGNIAFGDIVDESDNIVAPVLLLFASGQRSGNCEVIRFGVRDSREPDFISSWREVPVAYRETNFLMPDSAKNIKCGGFRFGGRVFTCVKQFIRSYEE